MSPEAAARLSELHIDYVLPSKGPSMFTRDELVVLAQLDQTPSKILLGSAGMMTDNGLAYLMWKESGAVLVAHGGKQTPATAEQVEKIQRFSADLKAALGLNG